MASQLKDLAFRLKKIGGVQALDSGKRKNTSASGSHGHDTGSTGPVENSVVTEPVLSAEEDPEVQGKSLKRIRTDPPVVGEGVNTTATIVAERPPVPGPSASATTLQTPNDWISSIPATDRKQELFDNYDSPQKKRILKRESFDKFVGRLTDKMTLVSEFT